MSHEIRSVPRVTQQPSSPVTLLVLAANLVIACDYTKLHVKVAKDQTFPFSLRELPLGLRSNGTFAAEVIGSSYSSASSKLVLTSILELTMRFRANLQAGLPRWVKQPAEL